MALLLIYDRNNTHADPVKELAGCWKRGDIVEVMDDSVVDGVANPIMPPFILVHVQDVTRAQALKYMDAQRDQSGAIMRRRLYRVLVDATPQQIRNAIGADRYVSVTWPQLRSYVQNKQTGQTE